MKIRMFFAAAMAIALLSVVVVFFMSRSVANSHNDKIVEESGRIGAETRGGGVSPLRANSLPLESKENMLVAYEIIRNIPDDRDASYPVDVPTDGMILPEDALRVATHHLLESCSTNHPRIILVDGIYAVRFYRHPNPFQKGKFPSLDVGIDALSGEFLVGLRGGGGSIRLKNIEAAGAASEEDRTILKERYFGGAKTLMMNVFHGRPWESDRMVGMISKEQALIAAVSIVKDRKYDRTAEPLVLLVDDLYMVTFWLPDREKFPDYAFTYDARVGIDAYTGEFIAKETTR